MNIRKQTMIFVAVVIAAIIVYDIYAIVMGGTEASISHLLITWSYQHPVFPFVMGFTMGHLFWRMRQTKELNDLKAYIAELENDKKTQ